MKTTILLIILCYSNFALAFQKIRPMVSNIYFANNMMVAVVVVNNDNHFYEKWKMGALFFMLPLQGAQTEKISKELFTSKFLKRSEELSVFNEGEFFLTKTPGIQKITSRSGLAYNIKNIKCKIINELEEECEELLVEYDKSKEIIKLPIQIKSNLMVTSIEKFGDYLLIGAGAEAELELRPRGLFAFNLKTKTFNELPMFSYEYITLLKNDDNSSYVWVAGSLGVHKLDKDLKVVKACPLIFKEGKESEATISCMQ